MFQYVLFDLDGTLTDPKEGICKSVQYALKKAQIDEPDLDKLEPFIGPPLTDSFREFYHMDEKAAKKAVEDYRERFAVTGIYENKVYPGMEDLLKKLKGKNCMLAVASSKPQVFVEKILVHFHLRKYFDVVVGSELDGSRVKKEEVVEEALRQLYEEKKEDKYSLSLAEKKKKTVMVGDRKFDIEGAKTMEITSVGVGYGYAEKGELKAAGADYVVSNVKKLGDVLLQEEETKTPTERQKGEMPKSSLFRSIYMLVPFAVFYLAFQIVGGAGLAVVEHMKRDLDKSIWITEHSDLVAAVIGSLAMLVVSILLYFVYRKSDAMSWKKSPILIPAMFLAVGTALGLNMLIGYSVEFFDVYAKEYENAQLKATLPFAFGLLYYVVLSPLAEELVFRWLLYGRIRNGFNAGVATIVTALFFGCYHGNVPQGIYAFFMGILLALVYEWSKSFLAPVLFHMVANASVYLIGYAPEGIKNVVINPVSCGVLLLLSIVLILKIRKIK